MVKKQTLIAAGLLAALAQTAGAAGMNAPATLLPPGYTPTAELPGYAPATADDADRSGLGEAELVTDAMPSETQAMQAAPMQSAMEGTGQADYVDVPALAPMSQMMATAPATPMQQTGPTSSYTQGITTGAKAYNEGNFTFRSR